MLEHLARKGLRFFFVSDDTFTVNKKRAVDICRTIIERRLDITWQAISRVDLIDAELLFWMRKAGCIQISYGVESGSERIRRQVLHKKFSNQTIETAFRLTHRYGILSRAYFIYGAPGESAQTIEETVDLMCRIKPLSVIFYILDLFPGTDLYEAYKRRCNVTDDIWLDRIEDILYFETDDEMTKDHIMTYGERLRSSFYRHLPDFVNSLDLIDQKELYSTHADFLSRLAMTFDQGDYAAIDTIADKGGISERLYQKALSYFPDSRAYLGLGIRYQKTGQYLRSEKRLLEGIRHFPENEQLNLCLGVTYMNLGDFKKALACLTPFKHNDQARTFISECRRRLT
jgi:radical SAM superfamily enzyme YgiQ (UPF0313 family)